MPRFIIDAPDQHRKLVSEISGFVYRKAVAEAGKDGAQHLIGPPPLQAKLLCNLLQPAVCLVNGFVENFEACRAHCPSFPVLAIRSGSRHSPLAALGLLFQSLPSAGSSTA